MIQAAKPIYFWPNPSRPIYHSRGFTLIRPDERPLVVSSMRLIELIPGHLYEIPISDRRPPKELKAGYILWGQAIAGHDVSAQVFVSFAGIYEARIELSGSKMEEVVLDQYIVRLHEICTQMKQYQIQRLQSNLLEPGSRTPARIRHEAKQLQNEVASLQPIAAREFRRRIKHIINDLDVSRGLLHQVLLGRSGNKIDEAKMLLQRVWKFTKLWETHLELEDLLLRVRLMQQGHIALVDAQKRIWDEMLRSIHSRLTRTDEITTQGLEEGAIQNILFRVVPHVHLADMYLMRQEADGGADIPAVQEELQAACEFLRK